MINLYRIKNCKFNSLYLTGKSWNSVCFERMCVDLHQYRPTNAFPGMHSKVKVKVQVYSLISSLKTYHPTLHLTPWSLDLFIREPFQLHREHTVLQPFRRIELIVHIAISVLPGTHFHLSQVKHLRVKCLAQGHNILTMFQDWEGRNMIFLWKFCLFLPHPRVKVSIVGSLRDREVACSASDRQGSNFEFCVWRTVSSQSSHHPQEVLLAKFSLYVHKGGLKPDSFHFIWKFYTKRDSKPHGRQRHRQSATL